MDGKYTPLILVGGLLVAVYAYTRWHQASTGLTVPQVIKAGGTGIAVLPPQNTLNNPLASPASNQVAQDFGIAQQGVNILTGLSDFWNTQTLF